MAIDGKNKGSAQSVQKKESNSVKQSPCVVNKDNIWIPNLMYVSTGFSN